MNKKFDVGWPIGTAIGVLLLTVTALVITELFGSSLPSTPEITIGLTVIIGVCVLIIMLFIIAAGFANLELTDARQALGLPEGSIRAMIALFLIMIWIILSIFLFSAVSPSSTNTETVRMAEQLITTMGTLVVAISAFYFGSYSVTTASKALKPDLVQPVIQDALPKSGSQGTDVQLTIRGKNFRLPNVSLVRGSEKIIGGNVLSNDTEIHCTITIQADTKTEGKWDLIVENESGGVGQSLSAFEVTPKV
jgi:hypothetical protein